MSQPVSIENDFIRMEVRPRTGGKVTSLIDKHDKFELLFNYPTELPTSPQYDSSFADSWRAGWDECFPAVAPGPYPAHPYKNINIPDHGELWSVPTTSTTPTKDGITTAWHGLRFGYRLTRQLTLEGSSIIAEYSLLNLAPYEFRFVWAMHALLSLAAPVRIEFPPGMPIRASHDEVGRELQGEFAWPTGPNGEDFSQPEKLPAKRAWKLFSVNPASHPVRVVYPTRGRSIEVAYNSDDELAAYWGVWVNTGGWVGHHHFAIEPTTGRFDQLDRAVKDGSAGSVAASGTVGWTVRWKLA